MSSTCCRVDLGRGDEEGPALQPCPACGLQVQRQAHGELQSWIQCSTCGKWRAIAPDLLSEVRAWLRVSPCSNIPV
jgi:hypothetical protein